MNQDFARADSLKAEWDALQPLSPENDARLWKKLRLEWNYHSNHIEGNTLTYGETELLLIHGQTTGTHQLRDYEEMKAHDLGIAHIRILAAEERVIGETDIRDLNKIILKEPFWKEAITDDGQPTRKHVIPGDYKSSSNNVRTTTGEIFAFSSPEETPAKMHDLVEWLRKSLESRTLHPIELVAKLHHEFVLIHPFDDGNGRVARLLVNYLLLRLRYPPLIVKSDDKAGYLTALRQADAGDLPALTSYLVARCEWSLGLGIRAAKGEPIDELSDVEKEIALFVRTQQAVKGKEASPNRETLTHLITSSLKPFVEKVELKLLKLAPLFRGLEIRVQDGFGGSTTSRMAVYYSAFESVSLGQQLLISFAFHGYQGDATTPFDYEIVIGLHFPPAAYTITYDSELIPFPYSKPILSDEADSLAAKILGYAFGKIKSKAGQPE